jgi:hypothetical protein
VEGGIRVMNTGMEIDGFAGLLRSRLLRTVEANAPDTTIARSHL